MKKSKSLRFRITFITSLLLIFLSLAFTLSGLYNLSSNVIEPLTIIIESDNPDLNIKYIDVKDIKLEGKSIGPVDISQSVKVYSEFSFLFMIVLIILGTAIMYILSGIALKPAKRLAKEINNIDEELLFKEIEDFNAGDELNLIANSFNSMIGRLKLAFDREKRFSSAAAHELKTPITVIKTNLEVLNLTDNKANKEIDEFINIVDKQINRMNILVDDLMILSTNNNIKKNELIYLDKLVKEIIKELESKIKDKSIKINLNLIKSPIVGNSIMIKHAISNIISNAVKYNHDFGYIDIEIIEDNDNYNLSIMDSGIGIDKEDEDYIFEAFYRVDKSRSRSSGGSGLGLAIAKDIIKNHEGNIIYKKNHNEGSNFIITFKKAFIE